MKRPSIVPPPIDLRDLHVVSAVVRLGSLTRAASEVGLTQSALTRQLQAIEARLGLPLFDRTTRRLEPTVAARTLLQETAGLSSQLSATLRELQETHSGAPREVRIGISRSVALAHLPGLLHAHRRRCPDVRTTVAHLDHSALLGAVQDGSLDLGILGVPRPVPAPLRITHRMADAFVLIGPATTNPPGLGRTPRQWTPTLRGWLNRQSWLHFAPRSNTGRRLHDWLRARDIHPTATTEMDNFDMIVHLAALGFGIGLVPRRALAVFPRRHRLRLIPLPETFSRDLAVVTRRSPSPASPHVRQFVESILFS